MSLGPPCCSVSISQGKWEEALIGIDLLLTLSAGVSAVREVGRSRFTMGDPCSPYPGTIVSDRVLFCPSDHADLRHQQGKV